MDKLKKKTEKIGDYLDISDLSLMGQLAAITFYNYLMELSAKERENDSEKRLSH